MVRNERDMDVDEDGEPTPTAPLIACLRDWDSPECRIVERHRPKFAPNFARARHGLITPVLPIVESSPSRTSLAPRRASLSSGSTPETPLNGELHERTRASISFATTPTTTPLKHFSVRPQHIPHLIYSPVTATHISSTTVRIPMRNTLASRTSGQGRGGDRNDWARRFEIEEFDSEEEGGKKGSGERFVWSTRSTTPLPFQIMPVTPAPRRFHVSKTTTTVSAATIYDPAPVIVGRTHTTSKWWQQSEVVDPRWWHTREFGFRTTTRAATRVTPHPRLHPVASLTKPSTDTLSLFTTTATTTIVRGNFRSTPSQTSITRKPVHQWSHFNQTLLHPHKSPQSPLDTGKFNIERTFDDHVRQIQRVTTSETALLTLPPLRAITPFSYLPLLGGTSSVTQRILSKPKTTVMPIAATRAPTSPFIIPPASPRPWPTTTARLIFTPSLPPQTSTQPTAIRITTKVTPMVQFNQPSTTTVSAADDKIRIAVEYDNDYFEDLWSDISAPRIILSEDIRSSIATKSVVSSTAATTPPTTTTTATTVQAQRANNVDRHQNVETDSEKIFTAASKSVAINMKEATLAPVTIPTTKKSSLAAKYTNSLGMSEWRKPKVNMKEEALIMALKIDAEIETVNKIEPYVHAIPCLC
ncbi:unnamed protein product [Toxocara canis]|uniref:Protein kinase domain-containing protein n=1 Tax=Toxocara canis TaxID=6265 RepID=A0A183UZL1_TOXCA|nr:unnamed protein product [Toxocara canis]